MANYEREVAIGSILASSISPHARPVISVTSPELSTSKSHIIYKVHGKDHEGSFEVHRRYRDFAAIRVILVKHWPGCYIPQIPPKQMIGNMDKNNIERRRKLLDVFVNKMSLVPHLYNSMPFQSFIKSPVSFEHCIKDYENKNYMDIAAEFIIAFHELNDMKIGPNDEEEVVRSLEYFNYALACFEAFEAICKQNVEVFYEFEDSMEGLMGSMKEINEFYTEYYDSKGYEVQQKDYFTNPYLILLDWCRAEILDLKAIVEAIEKRGKFLQRKKKVLQKLDTEMKSLVSIKSGKKKKSLFSPRGEKEQQDVVEKMENETKAMGTIFRISTLQLVHKDFLVFKQYKVHKHEVILRTFSSASVEEFRSLASQIVDLENPYKLIE